MFFKTEDKKAMSKIMSIENLNCILWLLSYQQKTNGYLNAFNFCQYPLIICRYFPGICWNLKNSDYFSLIGVKGEIIKCISYCNLCFIVHSNLTFCWYPRSLAVSYRDLPISGNAISAPITVWTKIRRLPSFKNSYPFHSKIWAYFEQWVLH